MSYHPDDTICAIATAPGGAARGMVRVSGLDSIGVVGKVFCASDGASMASIRRPAAITGAATIELHDSRRYEIPCDAFVWPTSRSYTREPVVELHAIGSPPLLDALVEALCRAGARFAEPGEFTLRAFLAGRIDLTQAEAVLGVIDSRSVDELTTALSQLAGGLARPLQQLRDELLQLLAELEAGLDFVEEDIRFISNDDILTRLESADRLLAEVAQQMSSRATVTPTTQVALVGAPNAGKSSLFNALVAQFGRPLHTTPIGPSPAIVSAHRGTTRDYLTAAIEIGGARCELVDTAGVVPDFAPSGSPATFSTAHVPLPNVAEIDRAAQELADERRAAAAIRVWCIDSTDVTYDAIALPASVSENGDIIALTKCDLTDGFHRPCTVRENIAMVATSSRTGEGLQDLVNRIGTLLKTDTVAQHRSAIASTAERCRESIRLAQAAISRAADIIGQDHGDELAATELRIALAELGQVVGAVYTDDLLDRIFSTFCIGK
jgi:tRNA modification GTPase